MGVGDCTGIIICIPDNIRSISIAQEPLFHYASAADFTVFLLYEFTFALLGPAELLLTLLHCCDAIR